MNNLFGNSFTTDDLLSTHPIMNDNIVYPNEDLITENDSEFKKTMNINLQPKEKIIIISSKDRNPYTETINNFSIFFNPNDNSFEKYPVYYNNPTIPQTYEQRMKGIKGDPNINGWKDKDNNIYPAYNPSNPFGDIICYDSLFISGNSKSSIIFKFNNIVSIKIQQIYVFENENINSNKKKNIFQYSKSSFININLSNIKSNFITNFSNNKEITDILYKDERFLGWWLSVNNSEFKYQPPINNLNSIKINWNYGYSLNDDENKNNYENITNYSNSDNFIQDILIIYGFEIENNFLILKTSFFSNLYWEDSDLIQIRNIKFNVDYSFLNEAQINKIEHLLYFLTSNDHKVLFTSLFLNIQNSYENILESIQNNLNLKNRIIIHLPSSLRFQNISLNSDFFSELNNNENNNLGNEKIKIPNEELLLSKIIIQYNDDPLISKLKDINNINFSCLKTLNQEWLNKGPYIMNISKQSILILKITYLEPIIQSNDKNSIQNLLT